MPGFLDRAKKKFLLIPTKGLKRLKYILYLLESLNSPSLDVYGFRPWKNLLYFSDLVILHNYDINLHLRNNILKTQSLIHNQFSSPR